MELQNLLTDLSDGIKLHALIEILTGKQFRINNSPNMRIQKMVCSFDFGFELISFFLFSIFEKNDLPCLIPFLGSLFLLLLIT